MTIFPYNNSPKRRANRHLLFGGESIAVKDEVKYLDITLDNKLKFKKHIDEKCQKALKCFRSLWPLINKNSHLNIKNKNLIYKTVIRPILTYGCSTYPMIRECIEL